MRMYERARAILESVNSLAYGSWRALKKEEKTIFVNSETNEGFETCPLLGSDGGDGGGGDGGGGLEGAGGEGIGGGAAGDGIGDIGEGG